MASTFVPAADESKEADHHHYHHNHPQAPSPRALRRSWSSNSSTCSHGGAGTPKCVCAPATHPGSFKCRLHRGNSNGSSPPTSPLPPQPAVSSSSAATRTVEAQ